MRRFRRANSAIEFALALPLFLSIAAAIIEYGNFFEEQVEMTGIVREAARDGVLQTQNQADGPVQTAEASIQQSLAKRGYTGTANIVASIQGTAPDQLLVVAASLPYHPLMGIVPSPQHVSGQMVLRLYDQR